MLFEEFSPRSVCLKEGELLRRREENRRYLMSLSSEALLLNYTHEAGLDLSFNSGEKEDMHGGWESPLCQLRGHFLGHWLSAAAMHWAATGDIEIKAKADAIVSVLAECQQSNGGEWVGSIPEKYLTWIAQGHAVWAPQYTLHKTLMGLMDMYELAGNEEALSIAVNFAKWFTRWSSQFTREEFDNILDVETGGMLEVWTQLYKATGAPEHRALMDTYYRGRLFDALLRGEDVLTNMHANTTIPEVLGAAKAYEVTGEQKWMDIVKAYWDMAGTERGCYATGSQTCGEIWTPKHELNARLGDKNQEHCVVYNMMRLADFLFRWTGEARFADYWERNLYNGIMAQGYWDGHGNSANGMHHDHPLTGLLTYFLPLRGGSQKMWASRKHDFFCCHGTLVQANAIHNHGIYYKSEDAVAICQYFASDLRGEMKGTPFMMEQRIDTLAGTKHLSSDSSGKQTIGATTRIYPHDPNKVASRITIRAEKPVEFTLLIRVPSWVKAEPALYVNGEQMPVSKNDKGFMEIRRLWENDEVYFEFQKGITAVSLPGDENQVAFLNGPVVLAGLCEEERTLYAGENQPLETLLVPDNEREWGNWKQTFKTVGQDRGIRFWPLYQVGYEKYSVYFPIKRVKENG